ncbi:G-type lectin S-receptor-like serine/threonine-protein kinase At5g24080 [Amborella trichopoda]|nr:G-type lectin S-receptor-like serine/threonine-protein kinase At5g24080 [Amborella trichopoda]|eukprot:XP_020521982.1 G-type lectin S-receptor-like serine/threonine-protein kinase At5g24080 [Amborella trichopoda]
MGMGNVCFLVLRYYYAILIVVWHGSISLVGGGIALGTKMSVGDNRVWISDNGTFAFGFHPTSSSPQQFELAIWFARLPGERTLVWTANRKIPVSRDAVVELDNSGNLQLMDGDTVVWMSGTKDVSVESGEMSESGNLVLRTLNFSVVWQSFSAPTDTLLPGQQLTESLYLTTLPTSSQTYYSLEMLQEPTSLNLALTYYAPQMPTNYSYWSGPQISNATGSVVAQLDYSGSFSLSYGRLSSGLVYIYQNENDEERNNSSRVFRRVTLGNDGNLRLYRWDTTNGSQWVVDWAAVSSPCEVAGSCGNGICSLDGPKSNASCGCTPGYAAVDPREPHRGCIVIHQVSCGQLMKMHALPQTNYFAGDSIIANYSNVSGGTACGEVCMSDCNCMASVYGLSEAKPYCWTLRNLFFGGFQDPGATMFVKIGSEGGSTTSGSGGSSEGGGGGGSSTRIARERVLVLPIALCTGVLIGLLCLLLLHSVRRRRLLRAAIDCSAILMPGAPVNFSFHDLQIATSNYSEMLGIGGFGAVYKGSLGDGSLVAVKKLERHLPHGEKEFRTEVITIGAMHHMNLVRLRGFCSEGLHRLLVYEFMKNGSLDKWLFPSSQNRDRLLDWKTRFKIAVETAQGIAYFHEQCRDRIIHCDIKPENILLDENFCAKVSDFGLAKLMGREHSHVVTMVRGTRGYLAPEWVTNRAITVKADVYSYGMLLLEIIGGRRNLDMSLGENGFFYPGWAFQEMVNRSGVKAVDKRLKGVVDEGEVVRALHVAFWCIQDDVNMRPPMGIVVKILEGSMESEEPPMPQCVGEMVEEGLNNVYRAMKGDFTPDCSFTNTTTATSLLDQSGATCSYSTMSPR